MARRFIDAREMLADMLDRHEAGTASPLGYPDYGRFPSVVEIDEFAEEIKKAERAGAVRIVFGRGRNSAEIKHIALVSAEVLYGFLGRRPSADIAGQAVDALRASADVPSAFEGEIEAMRLLWLRGKTWNGFSPTDRDLVRLSFVLGKAILDGKHEGFDYRTFSRKNAGNSKVLEKVEGAVCKLLSSTYDFPPGSKPRDSLRTLGLEKFAQPLLVSGALDFGGAALSLEDPTYFGIFPGEAGKLRLARTPEYVLTIENFASFNRHVAEADRSKRGITLYIGGYPSLATQNALATLAMIVPGDVPFYHWSDIDPDGTWIFRTIHRAIGRPLFAHLMSPEIAETHGTTPERGGKTLGPDDASPIADLIEYLRRPDAKWMEQEELDPIIPGENAASAPGG